MSMAKRGYEAKKQGRGYKQYERWCSLLKGWVSVEEQSTGDKPSEVDRKEYLVMCLPSMESY